MKTGCNLVKNDTPKISALNTHKSVVATPLKFYIFDVTKYAKYGQVCIFGIYFDAPNVVKWGVPEKILQNAVQTRWS